MNYKELAQISQAQNKVLMKTIESLQKSLDLQSQTISTLTAEISELKNLLLEKDKNAEKLTSRLNGLSKIALPKKVEKRNYVDKSLKENTPAPTPKERGNNGAKRKEYHNIEEVIEEVEPSDPEFITAAAKYIFSRDVTRYEYIPQRLIKHIYRCKSYSLNDTVYSGKAPSTPLLNSNFDSSVIANIIQLRYVYGMPVERIVRYYSEMGFDLPKQTAHGLLTKSSVILDRLAPILKDAILSDSYIHFDETYHIVLDNSRESGSRKGYIWVVLSSQLKLIHLFYNEGSRSRAVFTSYLPSTYNGAVQCDGYSCYKVLDGWDYRRAIRLGCVQHCKRKFLEIENQKAATEIINLYNEFYQIRKRYPKEDWIERSEIVYEKLKNRLREIEQSREAIANSILSKAVAYSINELDSIYNIISSTEYELDNNSIERPMRYISISRKNSMFCGNGKGAERLALIYSLAISCRLNNINTYTYFSDIINRIAQLPPNAPASAFRDLLPDKWSKQTYKIP
ncbi:MAG: IS66 family transposase [Bacteroidales bacterium]